MISVSIKSAITSLTIILLTFIFTVELFAGIFTESWLNSLVLIEKRQIEQEKNYYEPVATGFITAKKKVKTHAILVTNEHVITNNVDNLPLYVRLNRRNPGPNQKGFVRIPLTINKERYAIDSVSDLAAFFLPIPKGLTLKDVHISGILQTRFLTIDSVPLAERVVLVGFPTSLEKIKKLQERANLPILWSGIVSAKYKESGMNYILIDAPSYWGNSGGPVFLLPTNAGDITRDGDFDPPPISPKEPKFIGVVSSMIYAMHFWGRYQLEDGGEVKDLTSAWHSGLSIVISSDYILKLVNSLPDINE